MTRQDSQQRSQIAPQWRAQRGRMRLALLALVGMWALLLVLALGAQQMVQAASANSASYLSPLGTPNPTDTPPDTTPTATHGPKPTPTSTIQVTPSPTSGASPTPTDTPTSPPAGGGGNGGGVGGPGGPDATKVALGQPTVGIDNGGGGGVTPSSLGSAGMLIASGLSCITALLGIIIAVVALLALLQGGYGPFLRALLLGKRAAVAGGTGKAGAVKGRNGHTAGRGAPVGDGTLRWQNGADERGGRDGLGNQDEYVEWDDWDAPRRGNGGSSRAGRGRGREDDSYSPRGSSVRNQPSRSRQSSRSRRSGRADW